MTLLEEQNASRVPWLVPVRHARTRVSPFTFYRGTARTMATNRRATATAVRSYRRAMAEYAPMGYLDVWYDELTVEDLQAANHISAAEMAERVKRFSSKARKRTSLQALAKLVEEVDGRYRIRSQPPLLVPLRELPDEASPAVLEEVVRAGFEQYRETLPGSRRVLLDRFTPIDMALKVVGVDSGGTRCFVMLLEGRDREDPLFLQIKAA